MEGSASAAVSAILVTAHRLTRLSASVTGSTTSPAIWRTLSILRTDGPLRVGALASASRVSQPTMTKLLTGLIDGGLTSRVTDADDSRATVIAITAAGESALDAHLSLIDSSLAPLFADLTAEESAALEIAAHILQTRAESAAAAALAPRGIPNRILQPSTIHDRKEQFA